MAPYLATLEANLATMEASLASIRLTTVQKTTSPFFGRTITKLPVNEGYKKEWEILGIEWLEPLLDENKFFESAYLPEGWTIKNKPYDPHYEHLYIQVVIDGKGENQAEIEVNLYDYDQPPTVIFLKINK